MNKSSLGILHNFEKWGKALREKCFKKLCIKGISNAKLKKKNPSLP